MSVVVGYAAMALLALQFGLQPILFQAFAAKATNSSVLVIGCEVLKFGIAFVVLCASGQAGKALRTWSLKESLQASGLPACTYAVQNVLIQQAYQNLPPIVFNLINQTKLLWTALFVFVLMNKRFSAQQCVAMVILLSAAVLLSLAKDDPTATSKTHTTSFELGIVPVLLASILSGVGAAITQRSMQLHQRDAALVTMELCLYGSVFLVLPMVWSSVNAYTAVDSTTIAPVFSLDSLFEGCDIYTLIPVTTNAFGGLLVGTVTKHVGGVLKSFALICGIAFTAFVESSLYGVVLPTEVWIAAGLVALSLFLYSKYPYQETPSKEKSQ